MDEQRNIFITNQYLLQESVMIYSCYTRSGNIVMIMMDDMLVLTDIVHHMLGQIYISIFFNQMNKPEKQIVG